MKKMKIDEFVKKVLEGEKDFSNLEMIYYNLSEHEAFPEVNHALGKGSGTYQYEPVSFKNSHLYRLRAPGIKLIKANLEKAHFCDVILLDADLNGANLIKSDLSKSKFQRAHFNEAVLREANVSGAYFWEANMSKADLRNVYGLESAGGLHSVNFYRTKVSSIPYAIIQERLKDRVFLEKQE